MCEVRGRTTFVLAFRISTSVFGPYLWPLIDHGRLAGGLAVTTNVPPSLRPFTAGLYISSAYAGGLTNVPCVVARATYVAVYVPGQSTVAEYTTRSSRISRWSNALHHPESQRPKPHCGPPSVPSCSTGP